MARGTAHPLLLEVDEASTVLRCEGSVFRELGLAPESFIGRDFTELVVESDTLLVSETLFALACDGGGLNLEFEMMAADGRPVAVEGQLRAFHRGRTHIYTRFSGAALRTGTRRRSLDVRGYENGIVEILGAIEEELSHPVSDILTFSHFSLADEDGKTWGREIEESVDSMEKVLSIHARGKGSAFRTAVNAVSTVHGERFEPRTVAERIDRAVGDGISSSFVSVDLLSPEMTQSEKLEAVEDFLGAASIKPSTPRSDGDALLSMDDFKELSNQTRELAIENDVWTEEAFLRATDLACRYIRFSFLDDIPWPREPTTGQRSFARRLLGARLDRIAARGSETAAPVPIFVVQAGMMELIDIPATLSALSALIVEATDFPRGTDMEVAAVYERLRQVPRFMLNGVEVTNNAALRDASRHAEGLELIALPYSVLSAAPRETIAAFQQALSARKGREIAILIKDLASEANLDPFRSLPDIFLSGDFLSDAVG
jgi:hypothetical protein